MGSSLTKYKRRNFSKHEKTKNIANLKLCNNVWKAIFFGSFDTAASDQFWISCNLKTRSIFGTQLPTHSCDKNGFNFSSGTQKKQKMVLRKSKCIISKKYNQYWHIEIQMKKLQFKAFTE